MPLLHLGQHYRLVHQDPARADEDGAPGPAAPLTAAPPIGLVLAAFAAEAVAAASAAAPTAAAISLDLDTTRIP